MGRFFWVTLTLSIVLVHLQSTWGSEKLNSEEEALLKEIEESQLTKEDVNELLPLILEENSEVWPIPQQEHHRSKRFIIKKKLLLKKIFILSKLSKLGLLGGAGGGGGLGGLLGKLKPMRGGYGYESPKPSYGPPPAPSYGPPPAPSYGPPPSSEYGAPGFGG